MKSIFSKKSDFPVLGRWWGVFIRVFPILMMLNISSCANLGSILDITDVDPSQVQHTVKKELFGPDFRFFNAVRKDSVSVARSLISEGVDINQILWNENPPENAVLIAVRNGNIKMLRLLIRKGADPNGLPAIETTPLITAIEKGRNDLVQTLIEAGADVRQVPQKTGRSALHAAVEKGDLKTIRLLIRKKAVIDAVDLGGKTPLMVAVEKNCLDCARLLLDAGASTGLKSKEKKRALDYAPADQKKTYAELLSK